MSETSTPTDQLIRSALERALSAAGIRRSATVLRRRENVYESTHRSEVLDCQLGAETVAILCKHGPTNGHDHLGMRHGLVYEAEVYRHALPGLGAPPRYFGCYVEQDESQAWLFVEYLDEGWQLDLGPETAIVEAAAMLGELQRQAADSVSADARSALNAFDRGYFHRCMDAAAALRARWLDSVPALDGLLSRFEAAIPSLAAAPQTLVHAEFTPHNVVWAHERPRIVDWEQAGLGPGEIDLAALTDDWEEGLAQPAIQAYVQNRWPAGPAHDFATTLVAARLYWLLRWLGDPEEAGTLEEISWLADRAGALAKGKS